MNNLLEALPKFKEYKECPYNCGAVYHVSTFTHPTYCCKDCNRDFKVPSDVRIRKKHFNNKKRN